MKFTEHQSGLLYAHENPFTFHVFTAPVVGSSMIEAVWYYANETGSREFYSVDDAVAWCYRFAMIQTLSQLQKIAPEEARTAEIDGEWKFVCNGRDRDMGYECCLLVGHSGQCYSLVKKVNFTRENER